MSKPIVAAEAAPKTKQTLYPEPFASRMAGRIKRPLGDLFGLKNFGVNLTILAPGGVSALHHAHAVQDEFIYVVTGSPTLVLGRDEHCLSPGMVVGFPAGGPAHQLRNDTGEEASYLEVGDRSAGDQVTYPNDDLVAESTPEGGWIFKHKNGTPY